MSTSKSTSAMQVAKDKVQKRPSYIKDGKKDYYRRDCLCGDGSRRMARDPMWSVLNS